MKKLIASVLCVTLTFTLAQLPVIARGLADGQISGVATVDGKPHGNVTLRLRNLQNGLLIGRTTASTSGRFSFTALSAGTFIIESVSPSGTILGTSSTVALSDRMMAASGISVRASAAAAEAAGAISSQTQGAAAGATGGTGGVMSATVIALVAVGFGLGVATGVVVNRNDASPSQ